MTDILEGFTSMIYNFGTAMLQLLGFQFIKEKNQWVAPSWSDFIQRVVEIVVVSLITVFMIKYVLLRLL